MSILNVFGEGIIFNTFILLFGSYVVLMFIYKNFLEQRIKREAHPEIPPPFFVWWFPFIGHAIAVLQLRTIPDMDGLIKVFHEFERKAKNGEVDLKDYPLATAGATLQIAHEKLAVLVNPEDIKYVTQTNFQNYEIGELRRQITHEFLGKGIFTSDGEFWKEQRNLAKPSFQNFRLEQMLPVFQRHADELVEILNKAAESKKSIDMQRLFLGYTLDCSGEILFDHSIGSLHAEIPFQTAFDYLQIETEKRVTNPLWKFLPRPKYNQCIKTCNEFVEQIIEKARSDPSLRERNDLLAQFMTSLDENGQPHTLDDKFLRDTLMNFLIAGRDTTAVTLTWLFYELAKNPKVQEKVYEEINSLFPDSIPSTLDELKSLKYLKDAINETLRLHSPVPRVLRCAKGDDVLPSGYSIKGGTNVVYQPYVLHQMSNIWGEDVLTFDPDRWNDERTKSIGAYEFLPFHGGPRRCLGFDMAYNEVRTCAIYLLKNFTFTLDSTVPVEPLGAITLMAKNGLFLYIHKRS